MSKYRGPRLRLVRKFGPLHALTKKRSKKKRTPGQHGKLPWKFWDKASPYGKRLIQKQTLRFYYNVNERQLVRYVNQAKRANAPTGQVLFTLLEMRLDNIVYRLELAPTIAAARQLVVHGHILVNQKKVTIPSYSCQLKDAISVKQTKKSQKLVKKALPSKRKSRVPNHLRLNRNQLTGVVTETVSRNNVGTNADALFVIEYYSRK